MGSERLRWGAAADSPIGYWVWQQQAVRTSLKTMRVVQRLPESSGNLHCDHWRGQTAAAESYLSPATRCTTTLWGRREVTAETEGGWGVRRSVERFTQRGSSAAYCWLSHRKAPWKDAFLLGEAGLTTQMERFMAAIKTIKMIEHCRLLFELSARGQSGRAEREKQQQILLTSLTAT